MECNLIDVSPNFKNFQLFNMVLNKSLILEDKFINLFIEIILKEYLQEEMKEIKTKDIEKNLAKGIEEC
jgi:hypothetical protein